MLNNLVSILKNLLKFFNKNNIDYLALVGDRFESLAAAAASIPFRIPIFHFHGGEISFGSIDEINRHMITKASHIHFLFLQMDMQKELIN